MALIRAGKAWHLAIDRKSNVTVVGAGIFGLWQALTLARLGLQVKLIEASTVPFAVSASRWAGAMLAPDCEAEAAPGIVRDLGRTSIALWRDVYPELQARGTLVLAAARDLADLERFARLTERHQTIDGVTLNNLEPAISGRFSKALFYPHEAHMDGVGALHHIFARLRRLGVDVVLGEHWDGVVRGPTVDCRGYAASGDVKGLRGVRGERLLIHSDDIKLTRPVRLLHPRQPIYVVPQGEGRYVVGATVIERDDDSPVTVRSTLELLGSAYALHPGFAEARVLDAGAGVRPAFADNVPKIVVDDGGKLIRVNGAYRHGFLLAPVLAQMVAAYLKDGTEGALMTHADGPAG